MTKILHINASPREEKSASLAVAMVYLNEARRRGADVDSLDLWGATLTPFDGDVLAAKYAFLAGEPVSAEQQAAWEGIVSLGRRFHDADVLLLSVPMWNFGIPYRLKHLIDLVTQKDVTFRFDDAGFRGMLQGKKAVLVCARGLNYGEGGFPESEFDFQASYLKAWLKFIGVEDVAVVRVEETLMGPEKREASVSGARAEAEALARYSWPGIVASASSSPPSPGSASN